MAKRTRIMIIETFEQKLKTKKLEDITVTELVTDCDINRKTFYYYFTDIDDLLEKAFDYEIESFYSGIEKRMTSVEAVTELFDFMALNRDIIYHVYESVGIENIEQHVYRLLYQTIYGNIEEAHQKELLTEGQADIITRIYVFIVVGFIVNWLNNKMKRSKTDVIKEMFEISAGSLDLMIENCRKINENKIKNEDAQSGNYTEK